MEFRAHHVAISVRDMGNTVEFYRRFGFEPSFRLDADDVSIAHLTRPDGMMLEVFRYPANAAAPRARTAAGNAMETLGVKHVAFQVQELDAARGALIEDGCEVTAITHGRTGLDFFFVADPDGLWIEVVHERA